MERQDFIRGLRELADIYEQKPQLEVPYMSTWWIFTFNAESFVRQISAFGSGVKKYLGEDVEFTPHVQLALKISCKRAQVCTRRVVGTRLVPEKVLPEQIIPAHEEEIVEWDCGPLLAVKGS